MVHQCSADTLPLILVDHREGDFRFAGLHDHVTRAPPTITDWPPSSIRATKATWLTKSTFTKNSISGSEKSRFAAKNLR
jgi:hypothetical protein